MEPTPAPVPTPDPTPTPNPTPTTPASTSIYTYEVLSDGTIRITSCQTSDVNLVIPDTIDGYTVTEIGANAFANQTSIQMVKFPANLKQIGVKAFANCTGLLEVTLPDTIQGAGQLCFSGCTALKKAVLNKGRRNIVYGMFENCTSLTEVVIPDTVENVAMYAFLKTIYSFKKLKKNKYYYVRVRAYVYNSNHKKVYGSWSAVKKVKIKK